MRSRDLKKKGNMAISKVDLEKKRNFGESYFSSVYLYIRTVQRIEMRNEFDSRREDEQRFGVLNVIEHFRDILQT